MSIAAVVVTHNRFHMLIKCIAALEAQTYPCKILVVDNASEDQTQEWLKNYQKTHSNMHVCRLNSNIGGAGGFHHGIVEGIAQGHDYMWLMDDDCLPEPDALEKLMEADALLGGAKNYGFLSSVVLWTDGRECKMNRQKILKKHFEHIELLKHGLLQVEQATFVSLLVPRSTILRAGLPIKEFFIWGDDIEFTRRITVRNGLPSYMAGQSQVIHAMESNTGSDIATDRIERIARYNYAYRNENYLYRQEGVRGVIYYTAKCAWNILKIVRKARNKRFARIGIIIRQFFCGFFFQPKIEYITSITESREQ